MDFKSIEEVLGYEFKNKGLLKQAFVRESYAKEELDKGINIESNEKIEFYGDSVLNMIVVSALTDTSIINDLGLVSSKNQEQLSNAVRYWTNKMILSSRIDKLNLSKHLKCSKGDENNNINNETSVKEDLFEAIIGALWFDNNKDISKISDIVLNLLDFNINDEMYEKDPMSVLKEWCDKNQSSQKLNVEFDSGFHTATLIIKSEKEQISRVSKSSDRREAIINVYKSMIELLCVNNDKHVVIDFDRSNALSKLNEINQKNIINGKEEWSEETNVSGLIHIVKYNTIKYGVFEGSGKTKKEAKTELALSILTFISKIDYNINK